MSNTDQIQSNSDQIAVDPFELPAGATWAESVKLFQTEAALRR